MVALTQSQIDAIFQSITNQIVKTRTCDLTKAQIKQAISDTDAWIDANAASYNNALSLAVRTSLTTSEKSALFAFIALKKFGG